MRFTSTNLRALLLVLAGVLLSAGAVRAGVEAVSGGVRFTLREPLAGSVSVAGEFNGWNASATPMTKDADGVWSATVPLGPGQHEYKFVIDGQWVADPDNPVTAGDFGNSVIRIDANGELVRMKATSNTELSPKIFLGSRYISLFRLRQEDPDDQWNLNRPRFDIDLDYQIRINDALDAHVLTNINNEAEGVQPWETRLVFDRGSLNLVTEDIRATAFDNDSLETWDDPLTLIGDVGIYSHDWGYDLQGVSFWKDWNGFEAQLIYSDVFRTGGTDGGAVSLNLGSVPTPELPVIRASGYGFSDSDNNKDVLAARVKRDLGSGLRAGFSYRLDRGANPGVYTEVERRYDEELADADFLQTEWNYGNTFEDWQAGGLDLRYENRDAGIDLFGEFLVGESWISTGTGTRTRSAGSVEAEELTQIEQGRAESRDIRLDTSRRFILGGHYYAYRGWHWRGSVEFEDHDYSDAAVDSAFAVYNRMTTYRLGVEFDGDEWMGWPWEAGLDLEYFDFSYGADLWETQFWFDVRNFWLEQGEHLVTVDRMVMLGGNDVLSWRPHFRWTFFTPRNATIAYRGVINATDFGREPKYWADNFMLGVDLGRRLRLGTDTRIARYDDPFLELDETFVSHFVELKYRFTEFIEVGLSWGVDPWVIDETTNQYDHIGRDTFLFERGANGVTARDRYLDLGDTIRRAEEQLEEENRVQLEAIVRF